MEYKFIDCYCSFGEPQYPVEGISYKKEDIRKKLEEINVKKAFCFNNKGDNSVTSSDDFFIASYTLDTSCDLYEFEKLFSVHNAKMINVNPVLSAELFGDDTYKAYFSVMDKYKAVITLNVEMATKENLENMLDNYKNIKIIVVGIGYADISHIIDLMKKYDNLYIDTGYTSISGLEDIIRTVGSERIVFSSYMPEADPSGYAGRIILLSVSDEEKQNIAYRNISLITRVEI